MGVNDFSPPSTINLKWSPAAADLAEDEGVAA